MARDLKIILVTHKEYDFPNAKYYIPIQVGKALSSHKLNIQGDDVGDNISIKNSSFCELTALYWVWKNNFIGDSDYVGFVHYRRYFSGERERLGDKRISSDEEFFAVLKKYDCIVPKKRKYYIETIYNHYKNAHLAKI